MILIYFLTLLIASVSCYSGPNITTYYGNITGTNITVLGENMTEYLGVPYANPPIGPYRFKEPTELQQNRINGTYFAVHQGDACPQIIKVMNFSGYDDSNPKNGTDENCLKLNMWVPESKEQMPVLVFFHGGSWTVRTGFTDKFNGSVLALKTKSVVIVPNFRLGFFGFSYLSGEDGISGNMGLLDQQMVLKWINRTIESFNGNKSEVTIFGTSSGGSSVMAHLFSNSSKSLFKRGIVSSGTITHFMSTVLPKVAEINTLNVSVKVNCTKPTIFNQTLINQNITDLTFYYKNIINETERNNTEILKCLQNKTVTELLNATKGVRTVGQLPTPFPFAPINNDTVFFKGSIDDIYKNKYFNKEVDLILGRTADEATFFMATGFTNNTKYNCSFYPQLPANDTKNQCIMNETNFLNLITLGAQILKLNETEKNNFTKIYNETATTYTNRSIRLLSDFIFDCELSRFALTYANVSSRNVYFYEYNRRSPINVWPPWTGAMHGDDLVAIFGIPFRHPEKYINKTNVNVTLEQEYSDRVMWRIGNFTKSGNVTSLWKKLNASNPKALAFNMSSIRGNETLYTYVMPPSCIKLAQLIQQSLNWKKINQTLTKNATTTPST
uniref:COesterase domain-containing protein n=1 Tax=Strongyloides stercoralis TaxID=6248 RepID=A0A0K0EA60_STRER